MYPLNAGKIDTDCFYFLMLSNFLIFFLLMQSRREYERQVADEEAEQLRSFQVIFYPVMSLWFHHGKSIKNGVSTIFVYSADQPVPPP